jgi:hypothetical protein
MFIRRRIKVMNKNINTDNLLVLDNKEFETSFLGRILWFTISDMKVTYGQLQQAFSSAGIDEKYLPKPISPRDAFRRATKIAEAKRITLNNEQYLNLLVREVKMSNDEIVRQLVREVVDSKNVRLEYLPVANMKLENDTNFITEPLVPEYDMYIDETKALLKVENAFDMCKDNYNGRHVRELVQSILNGCDPVSVRPSGGVYFTPEKYAGTVQALSSMVQELSQYSITCERSRLWSIPVIDAQEHRVMVTESLEDQVKNDSQSLVAEMAKMLKEGRTVTQRTAEQYINKVKDLRKLVAKYEDMLSTEILSVQSSMDIAMQQARKMLENVEAA